MIEVEIKLPIDNPAETEEQLLELGFRKGKIIREVDTYFDSEIRPIRMNDEALRIRQIIPYEHSEERSSERKTFVTFKGKKLDSISMTRKELETNVEDSEIIKEMFHVLGFYETSPIVEKIRREYHQIVDKSTEINACVDSVRNLGDFLELEIVIEEKEGGSGKEEALERIEETLERMGYSMKNTTRTSYLSMLQA